MEKKLKRPFRLIKQKNTAKVIEIDEMWHYVGKKNKNCGFGLLLPKIPGTPLEDPFPMPPRHRRGWGGVPGTFGKTSSFGCQGYSKAALGHL